MPCEHSGPYRILDLKGRDRKYLNAYPSNKAVQREREKLRELTNRHQCHKPIPVLIGELNRHLKGWMNYFSLGYPSSAYCEIERYVRDRLIQHLQRRSQRPIPSSARRTMVAASGAIGAAPSLEDCACLRRELSAEPDVVNLHFRFDEGRAGRATRVVTVLLLYPWTILGGGIFNRNDAEFSTGVDTSSLIWESLSGAPGVIRTPDLLVRSQTLYPTELRARAL